MHVSNEKIAQAARSGAAKYADEELKMLKTFSAIDCGTGDLEGNAKVVAIVDNLLRHINGIKIEHVDDPEYGTHIVAKLTPANPSGRIIVNAHLDTVFHPGDAAKYPFRIEGDTAFGLGIVDCKGGVVVPIYAVRAMQEAGLLPNKEIVFIFNCDEEAGTGSGHKVFDREIPGTEMAFVFEPSRLEDGVLTARKGTASITIDVRGKSAHAGVNYLDGRSATVELASKILKLYQSNDNARGIQFNIGKLYGGEDGTGVVANHATAAAGVRVANQKDIDTVKEIVKRVEADTYIEGTTTTITINRISVPMERNEANVKVYQIVHNAGRILGKELPEQATGGSGDASYFNYKGVPTVDALGPYMYKIHSTDESMKISSIEEKTALFAAVLGTLE